MQHLENVEFKLGTLESELSFAKFKEKSTGLVNLISLCDLFIFSLALNREISGSFTGTNHGGQCMQGNASRYSGRELAQSPSLESPLLELRFPHLED